MGSGKVTTKKNKKKEEFKVGLEKVGNFLLRELAKKHGFESESGIGKPPIKEVISFFLEKFDKGEVTAGNLLPKNKDSEEEEPEESYNDDDDTEDEDEDEEITIKDDDDDDDIDLNDNNNDDNDDDDIEIEIKSKKKPRAKRAKKEKKDDRSALDDKLDTIIDQNSKIISGLAHIIEQGQYITNILKFGFRTVFKLGEASNPGKVIKHVMAKAKESLEEKEDE